MTRQRIILWISLGILLAIGSYAVVTGLRTCAWLDRLTGRSGCIREFEAGGFYDSAMFSPDGKILAVYGLSTSVQLFDPAQGSLGVLSDAAADANYLSNAVFAPDGRSLLDGRILDMADKKELAFDLWNIADGRLLRTVQIPLASAGWIHAVAFAPGGQGIMVATGQEVHSYQLDGTLIGSMTPAGYKPELLVSFSHSGQLLAARGTDGLIHIWQMPAGTPLQILPSNATKFSFSPDDSLLAMAYRHQVLVWRIADGKLLFTLGAQSSLDPIPGPDYLLDRIPDLAFSPDGKTLAATSSPSSRMMPLKEHPDAHPDMMVRFWNLADGTLLRTIQPEEDGLYYKAIAFSPDGQSLALVSDDFSYERGVLIRLWRVP